MQIQYLLRYKFQVFSHMTGSIDVGLVQHMKPQIKNLIFHHPHDVDNYIRNNVTANSLLSLTLEILQVE